MWDGLSKLLNIAIGIYWSFWGYFMVEVTLVELRKQGKDKGHLTQILNSTFANPGGKKKSNESIQQKESLLSIQKVWNYPCMYHIFWP